MTIPIIADKKPVAVQWEAGKTYYWCSCGRSATQPYCDGAHKGSEFVPMVCKADEAGEQYLCRCKMTKNPPFCDGTHKSL